MAFTDGVIPFFLTCIAGLSTTIGGLLVFSGVGSHRRNLGFIIGFSAGMMIYISLIELLPHAVQELGQFKAHSYFFAGLIGLAILDFIIPHTYIQKVIGRKHDIHDNHLFSTGLMISIGLILHNIPEGAAVFLGSVNDMHVGLLLAFAIALHNIPEGIAVAVPIYHATQSRRTAMIYTFIAGAAEPLGAVLAYILFLPYLTPTLISLLFAVVAGVMVYISFDELIPRCINSENPHRAIIGIGVGMFVAFFSLISVQFL
jgi:ZIP family zinc transporter